MNAIKSLLDRAATARGIISECVAKTAQLNEQLDADRKLVIDYDAIDLHDQDALLQLAARKQAIELIPAKLQQIDARKGDAVRELMDIADALKRELREAAGTEQQKFINEIAALLSPYVSAFGGTSNHATTAAASMPIIASIGSAVQFTESRPSEDNGKRGATTEPRAALNTEVFDRSAIAYADEIEAVARLFLNNGNSFVLEPFRSQLSKN